MTVLFAVEQTLFTVTPEIVRIIFMRMALNAIAEKVIEALGIRLNRLLRTKRANRNQKNPE